MFSIYIAIIIITIQNKTLFQGMFDKRLNAIYNIIDDHLT